MMRASIVCLALALLLLVPAQVMRAEQPCDGSRIGRWANNANSMNRAAAVCIGSSGSTHIEITLQGGGTGNMAGASTPGDRLLEAPRGGSTWSKPSASRPPASSSSFSTTQTRLVEPGLGAGGANIIVGGGPMSPETLPNGTVVNMGGYAIGGYSFLTPLLPGTTTAFSPISPVPHIDAWSLAVNAESEAPAPPISLKANPDPGVVAIASWFWVQGYDGQVITHSKTQHASHTECRLLNGVPDCRTVDDSVTVTVHLKPVSYTWDFGDGRAGSRRTFSPSVGLGRPYTDPLHESPVNWSYEFDSRDFVSGFPVKLTISFAGTFEANGSGSQPLRPRDVTWTTGLVMRQVQTINVAPHSLGESSRSSPKR
jgi:hypothetical protein